MASLKSEPHIYICDISDGYLNDPFNFETAIRILPLSVQNAILAKKGDKLKEIALSNRLLELFGCSKWTGFPKKDLKFARGKYGKPYLEDLFVEFSMSNGCNSVVMVVQGTSVGIDVASTTDCKNWGDNYLEEFVDIFSDEEYAALQNSAHDQLDELFTYYWSMKESYMKLTGTGLNTNIKNIDLKCLHILPKWEIMTVERVIEDKLVIFTSRWINEFEIVSTATYGDQDMSLIKYQTIRHSAKDILNFLLQSL